MRARARKYLNDGESKEKNIKNLKKFGHLRTTYILNLNLLINFFDPFSILDTFHHFHEYKKIEPTNKVSSILSVIKIHCISIPFRPLNT